MAGGDGSQALVASIAIEHDLPFVVRLGRDAEPLRPRSRDRSGGPARRASMPSATASSAASTTPRSGTGSS